MLSGSFLKNLNHVEIDFINKNKIPENLFINAKGSSVTKYKQECKKNDVPFAYNTAPHANCGNSLKNRNGHCIICNSDAINRYRKRYFNNNLDNTTEKYLLFFDVETTGLPKNRFAQISDSANWPRIVQFAWVATDYKFNELEAKSYIIKPTNYVIPKDSSKIHGITHNMAVENGNCIKEVLTEFEEQTNKATHLIAHNIDFDHKVIQSEFHRNDLGVFHLKPTICTMMKSASYVGIKNKNGTNKWPTLEELYKKLFKKEFKGAHDAMCDVRATIKSFRSLSKSKIIDI